MQAAEASYKAMPKSRIAVIVSLIFAFTDCGSQWDKPSINNRKDIEGSYRILVCDGPCDFRGAGNVLQQGIIVFQNEPFAAERTESLYKAWHGRTFYPDEPAYRGGIPFGCFSLEQVRKSDDGCFAGLIPRDFTIWEVNRISDSIRFWLYRSVDGGYVAEGRLSDGFFQGEGESYHPPWEFRKKQIVIAQRIGPPDIGLCLPEKSAVR